jgi:DNA-3-methyladenine glycosylase
VGGTLGPGVKTGQARYAQNVPDSHDPVKFAPLHGANSPGSWNDVHLNRLPRSFFARPSTEVAPDLLGCVFWASSPAGLVAVRLVEVEAYEGPDDPASHAFRGKSARNAVMFGSPGHAYVYFTYGMHFCVNLVCQPARRAEAVLLRAGQVVAGLDLASGRRAAGNGDPAAENGRRQLRELDLARGPARLCQALGIDRALDGADVCAAGSPLGIGPASASWPAIGTAEISTGPRVGVSQAADRPWRYWLAGDGHVSVYRPSKPRSRRHKPVADRAWRDGTIHQ